MDASADSIRVVGEVDLLDLARVARSTWKNWARQGLVEEPEDGLFGERAVIEAVVVQLLVDAVGLRAAIAAWRTTGDMVLQQLDATVGAPPDEIRLLMDLHSWGLVLAPAAEALLNELRRPAPFPRGQVVVTVGPAVAEARNGFWVRALPASRLRRDRRRRGPGASETKRSRQ